MNTDAKAVRVLERAERDLRDLIAEAARNAEYVTVELIASWASQLSSLHGKGVVSQEDRVGETEIGSTQAIVEHRMPEQSSVRKPTKRSSARRLQSRNRSSVRDYPKFARAGDFLVKIAWSKSQKSEYRHKSPRSVLTKLLNSLSEGLIDNDAVVSMEDILPLKESNGSEIPDYQAYLCLAWLRSIDAVQQKGREGYTRNGTDDEVNRLVERAWGNLGMDKNT